MNVRERIIGYSSKVVPYLSVDELDQLADLELTIEHLLAKEASLLAIARQRPYVALEEWKVPEAQKAKLAMLCQLDPELGELWPRLEWEETGQIVIWLERLVEVLEEHATLVRMATTRIQT
jgi:hypothetical protein